MLYRLVFYVCMCDVVLRFSRSLCTCVCYVSGVSVVTFGLCTVAMDE